MTATCLLHTGSVATANREGGKSFDFQRATVFCMGHRLSKHKTTRYARNFWDMAPVKQWIDVIGGTGNIRQALEKVTMRICNNASNRLRCAVL